MTTKTEGMIWLEGGQFMMGSDRHYAEEAPRPQQHRAADDREVDARTVVEEIAAYRVHHTQRA